MKRIYLLVEGQTEEAFVNELLVDHYSGLGLYFTPIIVSTSPGHRGGVTSYAKIRPQIQRLCNDTNAAVSPLFDLYALPDNFPGKAHPDYLHQVGGHKKALFLEQAWSEDIQCRNFIPNLLVHEFEALLFTDIQVFEQWTDNDCLLNPLHEIRRTLAPEEINENPDTAPSKRILAAWQGYQKTFHGPLIACDIGLDSIRSACPHFNQWLLKMESFIQ